MNIYMISRGPSAKETLKVLGVTTQNPGSLKDVQGQELSVTQFPLHRTFEDYFKARDNETAQREIRNLPEGDRQILGVTPEKLKEIFSLSDKAVDVKPGDKLFAKSFINRNEVLAIVADDTRFLRDESSRQLTLETPAQFAARSQIAIRQNVMGNLSNSAQNALRAIGLGLI